MEKRNLQFDEIFQILDEKLKAIKEIDEGIYNNLWMGCIDILLKQNDKNNIMQFLNKLKKKYEGDIYE